MMYAAVAANGDQYDFGSGSNVFRLTLQDIINRDIFKMLPGGGKAAALKGFATYSDQSSWKNVPLVSKGKKTGEIKNVLLSQTITLFFNIELNDRLGNWKLQSEFYTSALKGCGIEEAYLETETFNIPQSVIDYLDSSYSGGATVETLFDLANKALGEEFIGGLSHSAINSAVDAINRGFDGCRVLKTAPYEVFTKEEETKEESIYISETTVDVYPIPVASEMNITLSIQYDSKVSAQLFDMNGRIVWASESSYVQAGQNQLYYVMDERIADGNYILKVITDKEVITKLILSKK